MASPLDELLKETGWDIKAIANGNKTDPRYQLLRDVQGNILSDNGRDYAILLVLRFRKGKEKLAKDWIGNLNITSALEQSQQAELKKKNNQASYQRFFSFYLSGDGYRYFAAIDNMPNDDKFLVGMKRSQSVLKDPESDEWDNGYRGKVHAMLLVACDDNARDYPWRDPDNVPTLLNEEEEQGWRRQVAPFATVLAYERAWNYYDWPDDERRKRPLEHFGYVDGLSNPLFFANQIAKARRYQTVENRFEYYDPSAPLNLVLAPDPNGRNRYSCGSFLVYRKLEQNVKKAFHLAQQIADEYYGSDRELIGAFTIGRFRDGTPITVTNERDTLSRLNDFDYSSDYYGSKCPFHAHARQANSRDARERDRRIVRRGVTYGKRAVSFENGGELQFADSPNGNVGLLFLCFQSNIETHFEWIQRRFNWRTGDGIRGPGVDPVVGFPMVDSGQLWPVSWGSMKNRKEEIHFQDCVTLKGGEYFFAPSISFLKNIAEL